jgi:hypothetical protein
MKKFIKNNISNYFKALFFIMLSGIYLSCDLDESPIFLDSNIYTDPNTAAAARDGAYEALTNYNAQERRFFVVNGFSGLFGTGKNGNNVNNVNNANLYSLKPTLDADSAFLWQGLYSAIARSNAIISYVAINENDALDPINDVAGHAYFIRAWSYFNLVRLWGDIPLWLELPSSDNLNKAKSTQAEVYAQIVSDAKMAQSLMNGDAGKGYPKQHAASMLLAKLYMTMATNATIADPSISNYWQEAYNEAKKAYGQYTLVSDFGSLFNTDGENSTESIFELQISEAAANSQMGRNYTPFKYKMGMHFGWFSVLATFYDYHVATYPNDNRIAGTYLSSWNRADNGAPVEVWPVRQNRNNFRNAHPYFFKFVEKDTSHNQQYNSQNILIYRYADLLLMLAEISNELQNGEEMTYLNEVLSRAGVTPRAEYSQGQASFRDAIMDEYKFELLGEGQDAHNNRRRGFQYFLENTIKPNNDKIGTAHYVANRDLILSEDEGKVMFLPFPTDEINTNELID